MKIIDTIEENDTISRASQGWLKTWIGDTIRGKPKTAAPQVPLDKSYYNLFSLYEQDSTLFATVNTFVNKTVSNGWKLESKNKQLLDRANNFMEEIGFEIKLPNLLRNMIVYGDAFLEIEYVPGTRTPKDVHILETTEMEIISDEHGEIYGYRQNKPGKTPVDFSLDECVHFKWLEFGGRLFGMSQLKSLTNTVQTKYYAENYNRTKFQNYSPRIAWMAKNASDEQMKQLIDMLRHAKDMPHKDIVLQGDIDFKPLIETTDDTNFIKLLEYLRTQILMTTQVPPIMLGLPDNSNRSNSDVQMRAFESNVKSLQRPVAFTINKKVMQLLGFKNAKFVWNPLDKRNEKDDLEIAEKLAAIGFDDETIVEFLKTAGLELREGAKIKTPEERMPGLEPGKTNLDKAGRQKARSDKPEQMQTGDRATTRENQLRRSLTWDDVMNVINR